MHEPTLPRLLEFQHLLLKFSQIDRVVHRKHGEKYINESDSEHSYNLAMTGWYLARHFPELAIEKVLRLCLVHDLVEIHAGDTFAFADEARLASKLDREAAALIELRDEWPDFPDMAEDIHEYEERKSPEAKFVYALDKIMPMMQIYINDGYSWKKEGITVARQHAAKSDKVAVSPEIKAYYDALHDLLLDSPDHISPA